MRENYIATLQTANDYECEIGRLETENERLQDSALLFTSEKMRNVRQVSSDHIESKRRLCMALKAIGEQAELLYHGKGIVEAVDIALRESRGGE